MNAGLVTAGAFLLVFGVTFVIGIPVMFMQYGPNYQAPIVALLMVVVASIGGAILAYGIATSSSRRAEQKRMSGS